MQNDSVYPYLQGSNYEIFIHRAFRSSDTTRPGAHGSTIQNLIDAEKGESWVKHLVLFEKQLIQVKIYMRQALDRYLRMQLPAADLIVLSDVKLRLGQAKSTAILLQLIEETNALTKTVKHY